MGGSCSRRCRRGKTRFVCRSERVGRPGEILECSVLCGVSKEKSGEWTGLDWTASNCFVVGGEATRMESGKW